MQTANLCAFVNEWREKNDLVNKCSSTNGRGLECSPQLDRVRRKRIGMAAKQLSMANKQTSVSSGSRQSFAHPALTTSFRRPMARGLALFAVMLMTGVGHAENRKSNHESPNALQLIVNAPVNDVVAAVEQVSGDEVIYGTQSYQRERNLMGAHRATHSNAFGDTTAPGTVLYKVADSVLSPTNFKNSADMGTLTVRYI